MKSKETGRNDPCPCGSGQKYKRCHGAYNLNEQSPNSKLQDHPLEITCVYGSNMLMNRVDREAILVAKGFDTLCKDHVADIEDIYHQVAVLMHRGFLDAERDGDEIRQVLFRVLSNALKSFTSAFALLRTGWRLQPYQNIRNCMEGLSVVIHLFLNPEDLAKFEADKLKSTTTFDSAKNLMEPFKQIYGKLSEQFTHIGKPFRYVQKANIYQADETDLWLALGMMMSTLLFAYEVAELVFLDSAIKPRFWRRIGEKQYQSHMSQETIEWKKRLADRYRPYIPVGEV